MPRTSKPSEVRSVEILSAAARLFRQHGAGAVSVDQIAREAGIAKGTFYLHFQSMRDLLARMAEAAVTAMAENVERVIAGHEGPPCETLVLALAALKAVETDNAPLTQALDHPDNVELQERANIALVRKIGPLLAGVIDRGCETGDFAVEDPLSTIQFILAGQALLLGNPRFGWSPDEHGMRLMATLRLTERALGARPDSLVSAFLAVLAGAAPGTAGSGKDPS
ncbi:TetR family transcriptional regulator [Azospirillum brasilense]|uniref:helix-turn-helix domain-containing protein n=1 Tax=Azospirillum brasilense TaxID=192 RepID=UPI00190988C2|nr:TetR/AcrR family transcriptional regulator [Azospirillum brasilense]MBK3734294.1 TetR family transcriptional regulator [Azospirillum brasilense]